MKDDSVCSVYSEISIEQLSSDNYATQLDEEIDIRLVLQRLARLTQEEARRTAGPILEVIYGLIRNMVVVMEGEYSSFTSIDAQILSAFRLGGNASIRGIRSALGMSIST
jgi:hypothetical protein